MSNKYQIQYFSDEITKLCFHFILPLFNQNIINIGIEWFKFNCSKKKGSTDFLQRHSPALKCLFLSLNVKNRSKIRKKKKRWKCKSFSSVTLKPECSFQQWQLEEKELSRQQRDGSCLTLSSVRLLQLLISQLWSHPGFLTHSEGALSTTDDWIQKLTY